MSKPFMVVASLVFAGLAVGHVIWAITSAKFMIAGVSFPAWSGWPAAGLTTLIAYLLLWKMIR